MASAGVSKEPPQIAAARWACSGVAPVSLHELYESWWTGGQVVQGSGGDPSHGIEYHPSEWWRVLDRDGAGGLAVARGGELGVVRPGEYLLLDDAEHVVVQRRHRWQAGGFQWQASGRCRPAGSTRWRARIYVPAGHGDAVEDLHALAGAIDAAGLWFEGKVRLGSSHHRDQIVLWVTARDVLNVLDVVGQAVGGTRAAHPPPLALAVGDVGVAFDPVDGGSLGLLACGAVLTARDLLQGQDEFARAWADACRYYGLCHDRPWRHPSGTDPFGVWDTLETMTDA